MDGTWQVRPAAERTASVSVCLPARNEAPTIGPIVETLLALKRAGVVDQVVVVDDSTDGTAEIARARGAEVHAQARLWPELGPVLGKGDAMWRALSALDGELVCFLDADTEGFSAHFATGLIGALVCEPGVSFVKAFYRRPLGAEERDRAFDGDGGSDGDRESDREGGGRVNQLMARPALALFYPELAGVRQPLAGEVAARRELLERLPFVTGYGVEIGMLIDVCREVGLPGIAQVDLDEHRHQHQPLSALAPMAQTVLATIASRLEWDDSLAPWSERFGLDDEIELEQLEECDPTPPRRPPLAALGLSRPVQPGRPAK